MPNEDSLNVSQEGKKELPSNFQRKTLEDGSIIYVVSPVAGPEPFPTGKTVIKYDPLPSPYGHGVMTFMTMENFENPRHGLPPKSLIEEYEEIIADDKQKRCGKPDDWPRIRTAICRGTQFVIETSTPMFKTMLRFSPEIRDDDIYEIYPQQRPAKVEKGRVIRVTPAPANEEREPVALLSIFKVRYLVVTAEDSPAKAHKIWLVGLDYFRRVSEV